MADCDEVEKDLLESKRVFECPICFSEYDRLLLAVIHLFDNLSFFYGYFFCSEEHIPTTLTCGHSLCLMHMRFWNLLNLFLFRDSFHFMASFIWNCSFAIGTEALKACMGCVWHARNQSRTQNSPPITLCEIPWLITKKLARFWWRAGNRKEPLVPVEIAR